MGRRPPPRDEVYTVRSGMSRRRRLMRTIVGAVAVVALVVGGYAVWQVAKLGLGIQRSDILAGKGDGKEMNILLMGLDSRLDVHGKPLSQDIYDALHSGDASDGGLNANVLMYLHVPADGSRAVAFSIPRDDYVDLDGCPDKECKGKIKSAYGLAFDQESKRLVNKGGLSATQVHEQARDVARKTQINTVEKFLGVSIDHFVEVTMVAFFEIAQVVQPVTVCVKQDTVDTFSGANFKAGEQQINAQQAVAFVRQRRDTSNPDLAFTDMDRSRRQQAFIVSLLTQLKKSATLTNPVKLSGIVDVASKNTAIDSGLDPMSLARTASAIQGGKLSFFTLPVERFDRVNGQDVNIVDKAAIRAIVQEQIDPPKKSVPASTSPSSSAVASLNGSGVSVDVVNASGRSGAAKAVLDGLVAKGFTRGFAGNGKTIQTSSVEYGAGSAQQASALAAYLGGLTTRENLSLPADKLVVTIGSSFEAPAGLGPSGSATPTAAPSGPVSATGGGQVGPPPTALTQLSGDGVPCVK